MLREKGGVGQNPHLKRGTEGQSLQFRMLLCLSRHFSPFYFPPPQKKTSGSRLLGGWKGLAHVFIDNHTKSVVGRVLLTPKRRVISVFFREKHRKNDADLFTQYFYSLKEIIKV